MVDVVKDNLVEAVIAEIGKSVEEAALQQLHEQTGGFAAWIDVPPASGFSVTTSDYSSTETATTRPASSSQEGPVSLSSASSSSDGQGQQATGLTVTFNGQSFQITDPTLLAQIEDAASRGDFAAVANLLGPMVVQGEYGSGPNFTLPLTPDGVPIYLPGPTQENDGTTFENATGTTTAGDGGNDYAVSFDHESFIFDFGGTFAESVHYDVTLDFIYPAEPVVPPVEGTDVTLPNGAVVEVDFGGVTLTAEELEAVQNFDWASAGGGNGQQLVAKLRAGLGDALVDKLSGITVVESGVVTGSLMGDLIETHSTGYSPHGWLGLDGAGIGADFNAVLDAAPLEAGVMFASVTGPDGEVYDIEVTGETRADVIQAVANQLMGPLTDATGRPDSQRPTVDITDNGDGSYTVSLRMQSGHPMDRGGSASATFTLTPGDAPPEPGFTAVVYDDSGTSFSVDTTATSASEASEQVSDQIAAKEGVARDATVLTDTGDGSYILQVTRGDGETVNYAFSVGSQQTNVDGVVNGDNDSEVALDAQAERTFLLMQGLLTATDGVIPTDWGQEEYVAFAFGANGMGGLVHTEEWKEFVATNNLSDPDAVQNPRDMDYSMFDKYFDGGVAPNLGGLVTDGIMLSRTVDGFRADSVGRFTDESFEAVYETVEQFEGTRRLSAVATETITYGRYYDTLLTTEEAGSAGTAAAEGASVSAEAATAADGGPFVLGLFIIYKALSGEYENAQNLTMPEGTITLKDPKPVSTPPEGSTFEHRQRAINLTETTINIMNSDGAAAAVDYLLGLEAEGVSPEVFTATLESLPTGVREAVYAELRERVGGNTYFEALQSGREYSLFEDRAFSNSVNDTGALEGFLDTGSSTSMLTSYGVADRLQSVPPDVAARLVSMWLRDLQANGGDYTQLQGGLDLLRTTAPETLAGIATGLYEMAPARFTALLDTLDSNPALTGAMLEALPVADRVDAFSSLLGVPVSELSGLITTGYSAPVFSAMGPEAQTETLTYLAGRDTAQSQHQAFLALETPEERAAFLEDLTVPGTLPAGVSAEDVKAQAQTQLLLSIPADEAALTLINMSAETAKGLLPAVLAEIDTSTVVGKEYFEGLLETLGNCVSGAGNAVDPGAGGSGGGEGEGTGNVDGGGGAAPDDGGSTGGSDGSSGGSGAPPPGGNDPNNPNGSIPEVTEEQQELSADVIEEIIALLVANPDTKPEDVAAVFEALDGTNALTPEFREQLAQNVQLMQATAEFALGNQGTTADDFLAIFAGLNAVDPAFVNIAIAGQSFPPDMNFGNLVEVITHEDVRAGNPQAVAIADQILNGLARNPNLTDENFELIIDAFNHQLGNILITDRQTDPTATFIGDRMAEFLVEAHINGRLPIDQLGLLVRDNMQWEGDVHGSVRIIGGLIDAGVLTAEGALALLGNRDGIRPNVMDPSQFDIARVSVLEQLFREGRLTFDQFMDGSQSAITDAQQPGTAQSRVQTALQELYGAGLITVTQASQGVFITDPTPTADDFDFVFGQQPPSIADQSAAVRELARTDDENALYLLSYFESRQFIPPTAAMELVESLFREGLITFEWLRTDYEIRSVDAAELQDSGDPTQAAQGSQDRLNIMWSLVGLFNDQEITLPQAVLAMFALDTPSEAEFGRLIENLMAAGDGVDPASTVRELAQTNAPLAEMLISYFENTGTLSREDAAALREEIRNGNAATMPPDQASDSGSDDNSNSGG